MVPRVVREIADKTWDILDFGCGPAARHVKELCKEGFTVWGYDLAFEGDPDAPAYTLCRDQALGFKLALRFGLVYASNLINVQTTEKELFDTCQELRLAAGWDGIRGEPCPILLNYPGEPRKLGWKMKKMREWLREVGFGVVPEILRPGVMLFRPPERICG